MNYLYQGGYTTKTLLRSKGSNLEDEEIPLEAVIQEVSYAYFRTREDGLPEIFTKELTARLISVDDIAQAVNQEPSEELEISVLQEMMYPIIVTRNTPQEHAQAIRGLSNAKAYDGTKPYLNIIGNQRQVIADRNGLTHIHAFVVDTGIEAAIVKKCYDSESAIK